jgi:RimJ/RimL family protein N-acetyltransferase
MGLKVACLEVFEGNDRAIHVYKKRGYEVTGRKPGAVLHKGEYIDSIVMTRKLPSS